MPLTISSIVEAHERGNSLTPRLGLETRRSHDGFPLPLFQDKNRYDDGDCRYGEPGVQVDYPWWNGEEPEWEGLVVDKLEIAMTTIEVVSAFSRVPAYVPF
jgi:hypothetical protein